MTLLNIHTKKAQVLLNRYEWAFDNYGERRLSDCYVKPSLEKQAAFGSCIAKKVQFDGFNGTITGYNCDVFSYAFQFVDSETGEICLYYITKSHDYIIK